MTSDGERPTTPEEVERRAEREEQISDAAADAAEQRKQLEQQDESPLVDSYVASTGVKLKFRPVATYLMQDAARRVPRPEVPQAWIESRQAHEPNPNDPSYIRALERWEMESIEAGVRVALIAGTEVEELPDGFYGPDDPRWSEIVVAAAVGGLDDPDWEGPPIGPVGSRRRYLDWLRYWALPTREDIIAVSRICTQIGTLTEEELATAIASFRATSRTIADLGVVFAESIINKPETEPTAGDGE